MTLKLLTVAHVQPFIPSCLTLAESGIIGHGQAGHELPVPCHKSSVIATARMNFNELWRAVLRFLVFSESLSLVVFCGGF